MSNKFVFMAMLCIAVLLGFTASSQAAFTVTISDGTNSMTYNANNGPNEIDVVNGTLSNTSYGTATFSFSAFTNSPASGPLPTVEINATRFSVSGGATAAQFTVTVTSDGFNFAGSNKILLANTLSVNTLSNLSLVGHSSLSTGSTPDATVTVASTNAHSSATLPNPGSPFTITQTFTITEQSAGAARFTGGDFSTNATAVVPAPPALALLASGIPCALVYLRRRRKVA